MIVTIRQFGCAEYLRFRGYTPGPPVFFHRPEEAVGPKIADIQQVVASHFRLSVLDLKSARRGRDVARPRQIAMFLARRMTPRSTPEIARLFGNRDHTTVLWACKQIERLSALDAELCEDVHTIERRLSA